MSAFRKVVALALGHNTDMDQTKAQLQEADIPVSDAPCRGCADPCDEGERRLLRLSYTYGSLTLVFTT